jgi:amino acid adenylation domain-containing protein
MVKLESALPGTSEIGLPVATWRHHPVDDQSASRLVAATLADQQLFGCDLVKLTPASTWQLVDHGVVDAWTGDPIGRRQILRHVIQQPGDWDLLRPRQPEMGFRQEILSAASELRHLLDSEIPLFATVFNPLFVAIGLAGLQRFQAHLREAPELVKAGLHALENDGLQLIEALADAGVDGIFLAVQHANASWGSAGLYAEFGLPSDQALLSSIQKRFRWSMLHLHGAHVHSELFQDLPFTFLHYDMAEPGNPAPEQIERPLACGVATGPPPELFAANDPAALKRWVEDLAQRMCGRPYLLTPGCAVPLGATEATHLALVAAAREVAGASSMPEAAPWVLPLDHGGPVAVPFSPFPAPEELLSVVERFRWVVERHGERPALIDGRRHWTYAALQERVEALAETLLRRLGHGEEPVAVLLPQDARAPMALLAVLAAGRTPVPLDPTFTLERNRRILQRADAALVITALTVGETVSVLRPYAADWLLLDAEGWAEEAGPAAPLRGALDEPVIRRPLRGSDPAWLLFTSGTTGEPKGVFQNQRGLLHDVMQYTNAIHLCPEDRLSQLYSASVSGALRDIYGALLNGACLYPLSLAELGAAGVLEVIRRERLTVLHAIPGIFRLLMERLSPGEQLPDVRLLYLAGDRVNRADVIAYRTHCQPSCWLYVGIGSTENSTLYAHHFLDHRTALPPGPVPVGRELPDRALRLLGEDGSPVPAGEIGEIECTSRYLAQGYWRDPEATTQHFLAAPGDDSIRRFRSGDLARLGADGLLRFMGRRDNQIKIAGRRVEADEIEANLLAHPDIAQVIVILRHDDPANPRLIAYWVPQQAATDYPNSDQLRSFLAKRLPDYMVPCAFVALEALPLTTNGKLDRKALPAPSFAGDITQRVEPSTDVERQLHAIWAEVLGHSDFGITDNFFAVGGHSLAAARLAARIEQALGFYPPLSALFQNSSIADLTALLASSSRHQGQRLKAKSTRELSLPINETCRIGLSRRHFPERDIERIYPLNYIQKGFLIQSRICKERDPYLKIQIFAFSSEEELDQFVQACQKIAKRHVLLRTRFAWEDLPEPVQVVLRMPLSIQAMNIERVDRTSAMDDFLQTIPLKVDLGKHPPFQVRILKNPSANEWIAARVIHHIVYDIRSISIIDHETSLIASGHEDNLLPPADPANLLLPDHSRNTESYEFFQTMLRGSLPSLLPVPASQSSRAPLTACIARQHLDGHYSSILFDCALRIGVSSSALLLHAYSRALSRMTNCSDIILGLVIDQHAFSGAANKTLVGPFISILPLRIVINRDSATNSLITINRLLGNLATHCMLSMSEIKRSANLSSTRPLFNSIINIRRLDDSLALKPQPLLPVRGLEGRENMRLKHNYPFYFSVDISNSDQSIALSVRLPGNQGEAEKVVNLFKHEVEEVTRQVSQEIAHGSSII